MEGGVAGDYATIFLSWIAFGCPYLDVGTREQGKHSSRKSLHAPEGSVQDQKNSSAFL